MYEIDHHYLIRQTHAYYYEQTQFDGRELLVSVFGAEK